MAEKKTSKEGWVAIKTLCQEADKVNQAKAQILKLEFESLNMKDLEHIDDFCMKLTGLVIKIRFLGEVIGEEYGQEERIQGQQQLLLTEEEWLKKEKQVSKLLLTREEWLKRSGKNNAVGGSDYRVRDNRLVRDRCTVKYFNCGSYRHFVIECRISRKVRQPKEEVNLTQLNDDEPALLMVMCERGAEDIIMLTKDKKPTNKKEMEENTWYLDNGASNHMTGHREKFEKLYSIEKGEVRLGDGSLVKIEGKGTI
ncbi:uncharacterized protein LOC141715198 [Apium graveolens]|uniref:uncharacterized protein LOC141715198 n=1 Tax=Apium graveolens TaxID=4045 RepID=UPI003D7B17B8